MAAVTRLGLYGGPRGAYAPFAAAAATAALTTTLANEDQVREGGRTVVLTLTNDTWVASGATFNAQRQAILDGLTSAGSELLGWNNEVRDKQDVSAVARTSDTVVTITLAAAADYDITAAETVTATIPAAALTTSSDPVIATPTFSVAVVEALEATGGWLRGRGYRRRDEETLEERRERVQAERVRLGIVAPPERPETTTQPQGRDSRPTLRLPPGPGPNELDAEQVARLVRALEASLADELAAQAAAELELGEDRRRRLAALLLLAA